MKPGSIAIPLGIFSVLAALGIAILVANGYFKGHLAWGFMALGGSLLMLLIAVIGALNYHSRAPSASQNTQSTTDSFKQSLENAGNATQAQNAIGKYEEHHHHYPPPPVAAEQQFSPIKFVKPTKSRTDSSVAFGPEVLTKSENGEDAALLLVANDAAGAGAGSINGVRAQVVFRDGDNEVYGGFGTWLDEFRNVVDFRSGKRRELVVLYGRAMGMSTRSPIQETGRCRRGGFVRLLGP